MSDLIDRLREYKDDNDPQWKDRGLLQETIDTLAEKDRKIERLRRALCEIKEESLCCACNSLLIALDALKECE